MSYASYFLILQDQHDIKLLTYLMVIRLANVCPAQVLQRIDTICEPLKVIIVKFLYLYANIHLNSGSIADC